MRCFLGIELTEAARAHLSGVQEALRGELPKASYPRSENLHITLRFLGEVSDQQLAPLCESMKHVKVSGAPSLAAHAIDSFPPRGLARIIVASMAGSEAIVAALHDAVEQRCRRLGFASEQRRFRAHVTLARLKAALPRSQAMREAESLREHWPGPRFNVQEFVLFESHLHAEGSRYMKLASFKLEDGKNC